MCLNIKEDANLRAYMKLVYTNQTKLSHKGLKLRKMEMVVDLSFKEDICFS